MNVQLSTYSQFEDIPLYHRWQLISLMRTLLWFDTPDIPNQIIGTHLHPTFFTISHQATLISYAHTIWMEIKVEGQSYKMYGLGDVCTYPDFYRKGYGRQVVRAATEFIRTDPRTDIALLFTRPELEYFYQQNGWQAVTTHFTKGEAPQAASYEGFPMMQFLSERALAAQHRLNTAVIPLSGDEW